MGKGDILGTEGGGCDFLWVKRRGRRETGRPPYKDLIEMMMIMWLAIDIKNYDWV